MSLFANMKSEIVRKFVNSSKAHFLQSFETSKRRLALEKKRK